MQERLLALRYYELDSPLPLLLFVLFTRADLDSSCFVIVVTCDTGWLAVANGLVSMIKHPQIEGHHARDLKTATPQPLDPFAKLHHERRNRTNFFLPVKRTRCKVG